MDVILLPNSTDLFLAVPWNYYWGRLRYTRVTRAVFARGAVCQDGDCANPWPHTVPWGHAREQALTQWRFSFLLCSLRTKNTSHFIYSWLSLEPFNVGLSQGPEYVCSHLHDFFIFFPTLPNYVVLRAQRLNCANHHFGRVRNNCGSVLVKGNSNKIRFVASGLFLRNTQIYCLG